MWEHEVDFQGKVDSMMDIFRRVDMKYFNEEVKERAKQFDAVDTNLKAFPEKIPPALIGLTEPDEKKLHECRKDVIKSIITDKASFEIAKVPTSARRTAGDKAEVLAKMKGKIEDQIFRTKAKLLSNFKGIHDKGEHSKDIRIYPSEIAAGIKDKLYSKDEYLEENMRKKFLQEKIESLYRTIRDTRDIRKLQYVLELKIAVIREAIHNRHTYLHRVEKEMEELKLKGAMNVKFSKNQPGYGIPQPEGRGSQVSSPNRRQTMLMRKSEVSAVVYGLQC